MRIVAISTIFLLACEQKETPTIEEPVIQDSDGDGYAAEEDCDDNNSLVSPGAEELCDGFDNNCDGQIDEGVLTNFYVDSDQDGFGSPSIVVDACEAPDGFVTNGSDCDDNNPLTYPSANEVCDGFDNNCDEQIDEGLNSIFYTDADGDGFGDPNAEIEACEIREGLSILAEDCDDTDARINPIINETCDSIDNNCDGQIDEGLLITFYEDVDGDGFGNTTTSVTACNAPVGHVDTPGDCDDINTLANPNITEFCDNIDNNCDGQIDEGLLLTFYEDLDSDGYGNVNSTASACSVPSGYSEVSGDCDDTEILSNPGQLELCDTIDNNCDGIVDEDTAIDAIEYYTDADGDGFGAIETPQTACSVPSGYSPLSNDCDDTEGTANPGMVELCDGIDNNCDNAVDENTAYDALTWYLDSDGDGFGDSASTTQACDLPTGYSADNTDCNDGEVTAYIGAEELCDSIDNNCDGQIDEGIPVDAQTWYLDDDQDGFGDPGMSLQACEAPSDYVADLTDCDDTDGTIYVGAPEVCDGQDNDCDSSTPYDATCIFDSCLDILQNDPTSQNGVYTIDPNATGEVDTVCDMTHDGGGWTLVMNLYDMGGFSENDFLGVFGDPLFTDHDWSYSGSSVNAGVTVLDNVNQGMIAMDSFTGLWTDIRMACNSNSLATTEEHYVQIDDYTTTNGNYQLLGATANGTSYTVDSLLNSFQLSTVWHDNETNSENSGHYLCDVTNGGSSGTSQFGFCYTDFLNNNNTLDYGDSIVSLGFGNALGDDGWSSGFTGECGDMGMGALQNSGTFWIWIR